MAVPLADIFVTVVLYCAGPTISAEQCTIAEIERPHLVSIEQCRTIGDQFETKLRAAHPDMMIRGVKCMKLPAFMDETD